MLPPVTTAPPVLTAPPVQRPQPARPKATLSLQGIGKTNAKAESKAEEVNGASPSTPDKPLIEDELRKVWAEFSEQRKNQVAEFHLLNQQLEVNGNQVLLHLTNPVEEPILDSIKTPLIAFLREKLGNNSISVAGVVKEQGTKKIIYTNKEKFEHLAEKNPMLLELKERLGLDPDF